MDWSVMEVDADRRCLAVNLGGDAAGRLIMRFGQVRVM